MLRVHKLTKHAPHSDAVLVGTQAHLIRVATSFKQKKSHLNPPGARCLL